MKMFACLVAVLVLDAALAGNNNNNNKINRNNK